MALSAREASLTDKENRIYAFLSEYCSKNERGPSQREIASGADVEPWRVSKALEKLKRLKFIDYIPGVRGSIVLVPDPEPEMRGVPDLKQVYPKKMIELLEEIAVSLQGIETTLKIALMQKL